MKFTHAELVQIAEFWLQKRCGFTFYELSTKQGEIPDCIGFTNTYSVLIECKASRTDFKQDAEKLVRQVPHLGVGTFRFFMCEKDLIKIEEIPHNWGLIYVNSTGAARKIIGPIGKNWMTIKNQFWQFTSNTEKEYALMYFALRRLYLQGVLPKIYEKYRG